jgi:xanthine/CO dehydrogenase XdhC/CoxF family maturation factor
MLIDRAGRTVGSLSGGCLEEEVAERGQEVIRTEKPRLTSFDTRRRFGCNGAIDILIEPVKHELMAELAAHLNARTKCFVRTDSAGSRIIGFSSADADEGFCQEIHPQPRLIIFGSGPDSPALRGFGEILGWEVTEAEHVCELPHEDDEWAAAIIKSHNYGRDFAALQKLLPLRLRYLGLIGPRRRRDQLMADVLDSGTSANAELYSPTGLDLGSETPEEIALAIVAEVQRALAGGTGASLRDVRTPIHALPTTRPLADIINGGTS